MTIRFFTPFYTNNAHYPFPYPINSVVKNIVNFSEFVISRSGDENYSLQIDDSMKMCKSTQSTLVKTAKFALQFILYLAFKKDWNIIRAGIAISALLLPKIYNRFSLPSFSPKVYFQAEALMDEVRGKIFADRDENPNTLLELYTHYLKNNQENEAKQIFDFIKPNYIWLSHFQQDALLAQLALHFKNNNLTEAQKITDSFQKNDSKLRANTLWIIHYLREGNLAQANQLSNLILNNSDSNPVRMYDVHIQWVRFNLRNNNPDEAMKRIDLISNKGSGFESFTLRQKALLELYHFYLETNQMKAEEIEKLSPQDSEWNSLIKFEKIRYYLSRNNLEKAKELYHSFESKSRWRREIQCRWRREVQLEFVLYYIQSKNLIEARKIFETMDFSYRSCLAQSMVFDTPLHIECKAKIRIADALLKI